MLLNIIKNKHFLNTKYFLYDKHCDTQDFSDKCSYSVSSTLDPRSKSIVSCRSVKHLDHPRSSCEEPKGHILAPMSYLIFGLKCNLAISLHLCHFPPVTGLNSPSTHQQDNITQRGNQGFSSHLSYYLTSRCLRPLEACFGYIVLKQISMLLRFRTPVQNLIQFLQKDNHRE